jgi:hypothetical protein
LWRGSRLSGWSVAETALKDEVDMNAVKEAPMKCEVSEVLSSFGGSSDTKVKMGL